MATVTITLSAPALSKVKTISTADLTTLLNVFTEILQEQGNPNPTQQDCFDYWVSRWVADTISIIRQKQEQDASATVTSIGFT